MKNALNSVMPDLSDRDAFPVSPIVVVDVLMVVVVVMIISVLIALESSPVATADNFATRCDKAAVATADRVSGTHARGGDDSAGPKVTSPQWRRSREMAFRDCVDESIRAGLRSKR